MNAPADVPGWADNIERLLVIVFLGLVAVGAVAGGIWLTVNEQDVPDMLQILGAAAVGALGGLLSGGSK